MAAFLLTNCFSGSSVTASGGACGLKHQHAAAAAAASFFNVCVRVCVCSLARYLHKQRWHAMPCHCNRCQSPEGPANLAVTGSRSDVLNLTAQSVHA